MEVFQFIISSHKFVRIGNIKGREKERDPGEEEIGMNILEVKNVKKSYTLYGKEKVPVLHDVNLSFETGEFVSILGESGCGKSTLMNIIGGMDSDYEGDVLVRGKNLSKMTEKEMDDYRKNNIGFVFQNFNLIPHLSVLENVTVAMQMTNTSEKERNKRAIEILTEVGLKDHLKNVQINCPVDRSNGYPLHAHCRTIQILYWQMNLRVRWIRIQVIKS